MRSFGGPTRLYRSEFCCRSASRAKLLGNYYSKAWFSLILRRVGELPLCCPSTGVRSYCANCSLGTVPSSLLVDEFMSLNSFSCDLLMFSRKSRRYLLCLLTACSSREGPPCFIDSPRHPGFSPLFSLSGKTLILLAASTPSVAFSIGVPRISFVSLSNSLSDCTLNTLP